ncbi:MAG TPA: phosphoribosyltransferase family protein [Anaeromyxobacteraceae bacterium]|nr:phosphoribosyltransferase family protein [Anaeromyxobacteraceae bacterium]
MGVADGFALRRLKVPAKAGAKKSAVREIGWAAFGDVSRGLAARIGESYLPDVVLGVAKGGVFVGGALAAALGADFYPVRLEKRRRDRAGAARGPAHRGLAPDGRQAIEALPQLPDLRGKRVLVVDDVAASGATLARARALARKAGGREVKTAVLVVRDGGARPDWAALRTDDLVLFAWDYQLDEDGGGGVDPGEVGV